MNTEEKAAFYSFMANIALFLLKITAAVTSGSLAVLSSAFDSLNDVIFYFVGYFSVKESARGPDDDHPFGHRRMEPLAALLMATFAAILSFEIFRSVVLSITENSHEIDVTQYTFAVLIITLFSKLVMYIVLRVKSKETMSTALDAMRVDSRNDMLSNSAALLGIGGAYFGVLLIDDVAAILIAIYIAYSAYEVARKNLAYVVGAKPDKEIIEMIKSKASIKGIKKIGKIRAHYVGDRVHVEIEIVVEKELKVPESHSLAVSVQKSIESLDSVDRAFIHIDYM